MYVDIHTGMFKDYDYINWTVKAISMKNNYLSRCIIHVMCTVLLSAAKLMETSFKKKSLKKNLHLGSTEERCTLP